MMASNFITVSYDDEQLQYWNLWGQATSILNPMMVGNFSTESYDGKQLQY